MDVINITAEGFYREVTASRHLWVLMAPGSVLVCDVGDGETAIPLWSSKLRAQEYNLRKPELKLRPVEIDIEIFLRNWIHNYDGQITDFGLNWGARNGPVCLATPDEVRERLSNASFPEK